MISHTLAASCRILVWPVVGSSTTQHFDLTLGGCDKERGQHRVGTSLNTRGMGVKHSVTTSCRVSKWPAKRRVEVEEDSEKQFSETDNCESEAWTTAH